VDITAFCVRVTVFFDLIESPVRLRQVARTRVAANNSKSVLGRACEDEFRFVVSHGQSL
jgi:hypothetical protein